MACSSCNRNNRRSNDWGCRKAVQSTRWPSCNSCNTNGCGCNSCSNGCGSCGCSSCTNGCNSCGSCNRDVCTRCGGTNVCTGTNTTYAQPYTDSRSGWNRSGRAYYDWGYGRCGNSCFPFYCGPCGPVDSNCGCTNNCNCSNNCTCNNDCSCTNNCDCTNNCGCMNGCGSCFCREPVYGFFTQVGTIDVNASGVVPFNGGSTVEGIWKDGGELTLDTAGVYMVTLSADIPENVTLFTELDVRVNGVTNPGGRLVLDKDYVDAPLMANTQTVITVNEGAVVTVTSSEGIAFSTSNASQPIVTLSIVKLS